MRCVEENERASSAAVRAGLGTAAVFEALTVAQTQDKAVWAAGPWRQDPYHTVVDVAGFAVPMLALAIAVRLLARAAPGGRDRVGSWCVRSG